MQRYLKNLCDHTTQFLKSCHEDTAFGVLVWVHDETASSPNLQRSDRTSRETLDDTPEDDDDTKTLKPKGQTDQNATEVEESVAAVHNPPSPEFGDEEGGVWGNGTDEDHDSPPRADTEHFDENDTSIWETDSDDSAKDNGLPEPAATEFAHNVEPDVWEAGSDNTSEADIHSSRIAFANDEEGQDDSSVWDIDSDESSEEGQAFDDPSAIHSAEDQDAVMIDYEHVLTEDGPTAGWGIPTSHGTASTEVQEHESEYDQLRPEAAERTVSNVDGVVSGSMGAVFVVPRRTEQGERVASERQDAKLGAAARKGWFWNRVWTAWSMES